MYTFTYTGTHIHTYTQTHTHVCKYIHTNMCACMHTLHMRILMYTHIHTQTYIHMFIQYIYIKPHYLLDSQDILTVDICDPQKHITYFCTFPCFVSLCLHQQHVTSLLLVHTGGCLLLVIG